MSTQRPSKKQRELLTYIEGFIAAHGYGPSYREIMRALSYKSVSTIATHIDHLIAKGQLRKRDRSARSLEVVKGEAEFTQAPAVKHGDEKWLIDHVTKKFVAAESAKTANTDDLYVLVGALHILGFNEAARSFKARLFNLVDPALKR